MQVKYESWKYSVLRVTLSLKSLSRLMDDDTYAKIKAYCQRSIARGTPFEPLVSAPYCVSNYVHNDLL